MEIKELESVIDYKFNNIKLLQTALTHPSFGEDNYEKLEFLGDSILGFVVAEYLINNLDLAVGDMSKFRSKIVGAEELCKVANSINLSHYLTIGNSYKNITISTKSMSDLVEAIIGAIYLDSNIDFARKFIMQFIIKSYDNITNIINSHIDYKTMLQEEYQKQGTTSIVYQTVSEEGLSNDKTFTVELLVNGALLSTAVGKSKSKAEQECAKIALNNLKKSKS